jgi:hypothetical protein
LISVSRGPFANGPLLANSRALTLDAVAGRNDLKSGSSGRCAIPKEMIMKSMLVATAAMLAVLGLSSGPSDAAGCVRGAVIGGIAGHFVGHHGLLGAGAGCVIGHHEAYRRDRERAWRDRSDRAYSRAWDHDRGYTTGYGSSYERGYGYSR